MRRHSTKARWCPTPEQVMILDQLYRRGLRTPKASQIQHITAHLSLYGNIQPKNVFYWFQNHKARDRNKHQLHLSPPPSLHFHFPSSHDHKRIPFQGSGACEEVPPSSGVMRTDMISGDGLMKRSGHDGDSDSMMMVDVGPALVLWCCSSQPPPLQTLELFPLTSPTTS